MKKMKMMSVNINGKLPWDIVKVIFSKLPFLNLLNCRIVCRTWNKIVLEYGTSPSKSHLPPPKALLFSTFDILRPTKDYADAKMHCVDLDTNSHVATHRFGGDWEYVSILSFCNDLLHIYKQTSRYVHHGIWNPMTNEFFRLPDFGEPRYMFGFGCCPNTKEYKLFKILDTDYDGNVVTEIEVVRFGSIGDESEWGEFECRQPPFRIVNDGIYLDGVIYWIGKNIADEFVVYGQDVETETFEIVAVLDVGPYSPYGAYTQPFNDTICATIVMPGKRQVWVMKAKHFWIREFFIDLPAPLELRLIKASEDEGELYFTSENNLFCIDKSGKLTKIKTLVNSNDTILQSSLPVQSFHFGSLSNILAGND